MSKGIAVKTIFELFIAAIILFLLVPPLFGTVKQVYATVIGALSGVKPSSLEKAALCSYYRCTKGCHSAEVEETKWTDKEQYKTAKSVTCSDFCDLPCTDQNWADCYNDNKLLTVCGWQAKKYPVNVSTDLSINQKHMSDSVDCIITPDSYASSLVPIISGNKFVYVDSSVSLGNIKTTDECVGRSVNGEPRIGNAIESADIKNKIVYMYTDKGDCPVPGCIGGDNFITSLSGEAPKFGECRPNGVDCTLELSDKCCSDYCNPSTLKCAEKEIGGKH